MAKQPEVKMFKHQQHLKLQREAEEESWISGEELRTDGSSDEENSNKNKKKLASRRRSSERKSETLSSRKNEETRKESKLCKDESEDEDFLEERALSWRPKRGSLKLPDLYEGNIDLSVLNQCISEDKYNVLKHMPLVKDEDIRNVTNYNSKMMEMMDTISQLEEHVVINMNLLEDEKRERMKVEEEMCSEIYNSGDCDKDSLLFLNLCHFEKNSKSLPECIDEQCDKTNKNTNQVKESNNTKNFIQRNIELAAKAMSKLPLTDEEKKQLEQILSDIDSIDVEKEQETLETNEEENEDTENGKIDLQNAFCLSDNDKQRINEIDSELENKFIETQNLRSSKTEEEESFWKNLILERTLKEIDEKLAALKKDDDAELSQKLE